MIDSPHTCSHASSQTVNGLTFGDVARWAGAVSQALPAKVSGARVKSICIDSRKAEAGCLFVALSSDRDDGNKYVADAFAKGASAALVKRSAVAAVPAKLRNRLLVVPDPLAAIQRAASRYRKELGLLVIGVTGSNGKTTTRTSIEAALASAVPVGGTRGNLNNHIGVPISLLGLSGNEYAAVIEMGANHVGEIGLLSTIARPDIAVVTNIGYAHVGLFGSLAHTTRAKLEIRDGLPARKGLLLINGDDARLVRGAKRPNTRVMTFGFGPRCDVRARNVRVEQSGTSFEVNGQEYRIPIAGRHAVYAALTAIAIAQLCAITPQAIANALAALEPPSMRGGAAVKRGVRFVLDCYNANPSSMQAALQLVTDTVQPAKRVAVLGDMLELGRYATQLHRQLGRRLAQSGIRQAVLVGSQAETIASAAISAGMPASRVRAVASFEEAVRRLRVIAKPGDTVLLKASRALALERVYEQF